MTDIKNERNRLLVKISQLYYEEGMNQQDIAARLGISRPHVSRMLTAAKQEGIVQISIKNPYSAEQQIERALIERFGIHDALVVDAPQDDEPKLHEQLGRTCAVLLESVLKDNDIIGIMAGRTVAATTSEIDYFPRSGLQFVPLVGGWGSEGAVWHANSNTMSIADKLKSKYWQLHAPAVVTHEETGKLLKQEPEIARVLQIAQRCSVALIGIGEVSDQASIVQSGNFTGDDLALVTANGAVSSLCASFLDAQGNTIDGPGKDRMIGLTATELRGIPNVIAVAGGLKKAAAITAALRGKWIDILVTDLATAEAVLKQNAGPK